MYKIIIAFFLVQLTISPAIGNPRPIKIIAGEYGVISAKFVSIRIAPSINASRNDYAQIGLIVQILEISNESVKINNYRGRWLRIIGKHVDTSFQEKKVVNGWVFSKYIIPLSQFEPIEHWAGFKKFFSCVGDSCLELRMKNDGAFENVYANDYNGRGEQETTEKVVDQGKVYLAGNIFWFKSSKDIADRFNEIIVVKYGIGQYCLGKNIDHNSGECHISAEDSIYPEPRNENPNDKGKNIRNEAITL
ncbi:MAG: hypothetical protein P8X96_13115 [Desulfobacteraceae bacterium]